MSYRDKRVLITGGLGFIGSNLVIRLVREGARVVVLDNLTPGCGGNVFNLQEVAGDVEVIEAEIGEAPRPVFENCDVIFNLAGEISHIHSMQFPERDLQINTVAQLRFLLACAEAARGVRIVFAGTRQVYGVPKYLPVDEAHPVQPVDFNGVHKYAATMYHQMLSRAGHLDAIVLRLTNVYGPRMALDVVCQGFLNTYLRRMVLGEPIDIYGDGSQLRDPLYVDDAVEAFLRAGLVSPRISRSYNCGGPEALPIRKIAETAAEIAGLGAPRVMPFPPDRKPIDIGSYRTDNRRIERELGWTPRMAFADGLRSAYEFFKANQSAYLPGAESNPPCRMPEHYGVRSKLQYSVAQ